VVEGDEDIEGACVSRESVATLGGSVSGAAGMTVPGGTPANITSPPWSHSSSQSADTVTSAVMNGCRKAVYSTGQVAVSIDGGFLHRSVFGGAVTENLPMYSGTTSSAMFSGVKEELAGGMASGGSATGGARKSNWRQRSGGSCSWSSASICTANPWLRQKTPAQCCRLVLLV
jgi:hypothetical protein